MTEWIITSSLLIAIVLLVRRLFRGRLSLRLQYALWLVVLVRLLIPGTVFHTGLSVLNYLPQPGVEVSQGTVTAPASDGGGLVQGNPAEPAEAGPALRRPPWPPRWWSPTCGFPSACGGCGGRAPFRGCACRCMWPPACPPRACTASPARRCT